VIRRINYTGRRRIRREDVGIRLRESEDGLLVFDADLALGRYRLPPGSRVFLEAYRQTSWQRFECGSVGELTLPEDRHLSAFGAGEGLQFRIKVVEEHDAEDNDRPARIICQADRIKPRMPDEQQSKSLLPLDPGDFRDEAWRLEFDETGEPILKVSRHLVPDWRALPRTKEFVTLALPGILRSILTRIVAVEHHQDLEDSSDWRTQWLRFAQSLPGVNGTPPLPDEGDTDQWIDDAVSSFCRRIRLSSRFREWWDQES